MKKSIKSFLSLLLVLVVALPVFIMAGCGQSDNQSNNQTTGGQIEPNTTEKYYALQRVECGYIANNNSGYYELYNMVALTISTGSKDILKYETNLPREAQSSTIILSSSTEEFYALHSNSNKFIDSDKPTFKITMRYVYKNGSKVDLISEKISINLEMNALNKNGEAFATATSTKDGVERKYNFNFYFVEV